MNEEVRPCIACCPFHNAYLPDSPLADSTAAAAAAAAAPAVAEPVVAAAAEARLVQEMHAFQ